MYIPEEAVLLLYRWGEQFPDASTSVSKYLGCERVDRSSYTANSWFTGIVENFGSLIILSTELKWSSFADELFFFRITEFDILRFHLLLLHISRYKICYFMVLLKFHRVYVSEEEKCLNVSLSALQLKKNTLCIKVMKSCHENCTPMFYSMFLSPPLFSRYLALSLSPTGIISKFDVDLIALYCSILYSGADSYDVAGLAIIWIL